MPFLTVCAAIRNAGDGGSLHPITGTSETRGSRLRLSRAFRSCDMDQMLTLQITGFAADPAEVSNLLDLRPSRTAVIG